MNTEWAPTKELAELIDQLCGGTISEQQAARLEQLVVGNHSARRYYVRYLHLHASLPQFLSLEEERSNGEESQLMSNGLDACELPQRTASQNANCCDATPTIIVQPMPPVSGWSSFSMPLGSFVFSYLVAAIVMGTAILIGSWYKLPTTPIARQDAHDSQPSSPTHSLGLQPIGRITAMVDCLWEREANELGSNIQHPQSQVHLGDRFALRSGLLEISYDSGAKVILQGPVTYEVDSAAGGYLAIGKVTARLNESTEYEVRSTRKAIRVDRRQVDEYQMSDFKSDISKSGSGLSAHDTPLFTIKTPTAIVTDLGTEFGVEVDAKGNTTSHVFLGVVEARPISADGKPGKAIRLAANDAVAINKAAEGENRELRRIASDGQRFVRSKQMADLSGNAQHASLQKHTSFDRWLAYSQELRRDPSLLAYYDFQLRDSRPALLGNVAESTHGSCDGIVENAVWTVGRMIGKHALLFNGVADYVRVNLPQKTDDLTLATWICIDSLAEHQLYAFLASTGWEKPGQIHWQVSQDGHLGFTSMSNSLGNCDTTPVIGNNRLRRWIHLACVYGHKVGRVQFYVDGRSVGEAEYRPTGPIMIGPALIGNWNHDTYQDTAPRNFRGRMDELVILGRPLRAEEVQRMYEQGKP